MCSPIFDPVPESWLHLTMNGLGFADEVPDDRLEAIADEVFALWSSLDDPVLRFTHLFVGLEGATLVAERSDWLMALARAQRRAAHLSAPERDRKPVSWRVQPLRPGGH